MSKQFRNIDKEKRIQRLKKPVSVSSLIEAISYCIENKLKMDFLYEGTEGSGVMSGYRSVSPAAVGRHKDTENKVVRAFVNEGVSKSEATPKWRLFRLDRIKKYNIHYSSTKVGSNKLYREGDSAMSVIYSEIEKAFQNLLC